MRILFVYILSSLSLIFSQNANLERLSAFEMGANPNDNPVLFQGVEDITIYEIPANLVNVELINPDFGQLLYISKKGQTYVRIPVGPNADAIHQSFKKIIKENKISNAIHRPKNSEVFPTASRSYLPLQWSKAVSFKHMRHDETGPFSYRPDSMSGGYDTGYNTHPWHSSSGWMSVKMSDHLNKTQALHGPFNNFEFLPDVLNVSVGYEGWTLRDLSSLDKDNRRYVPAFSLFHKETSELFAKANGYTNVGDFVIDAFLKPSIRSQIEFFAQTGMYMTSPHSQNYLVEFDDEWRTTGKVIARDVGDADHFKTFLEEHPEHLSSKTFPHSLNYEMQEATLKFGILKGNKKAAHWAHTPDFNSKSSAAMEETLVEEFSKITGLNHETVKSSLSIKNPYSSDYAYVQITRGSPLWLSLSARWKNQSQGVRTAYPVTERPPVQQIISTPDVLEARKALNSFPEKIKQEHAKLAALKKQESRLVSRMTRKIRYCFRALTGY